MWVWRILCACTRPCSRCDLFDRGYDIILLMFIIRRKTHCLNSNLSSQNGRSGRTQGLGESVWACCAPTRPNYSTPSTLITQYSSLLLLTCPMQLWDAFLPPFVPICFFHSSPKLALLPMRVHLLKWKIKNGKWKIPPSSLGLAKLCFNFSDPLCLQF